MSLMAPHNNKLRDPTTAPRRPIDISISADYIISQNSVQKIDGHIGYVASCHVLLQPNDTFLNLWKNNSFGTAR